MNDYLVATPIILVTVHWEGEEFPLNIPAFATITQVKSIIWQQGRIAIPPNRQELCLNNPDNKVWLGNEMTVQQYGISAGTVLHVLVNLCYHRNAGQLHCP